MVQGSGIFRNGERAAPVRARATCCSCRPAWCTGSRSSPTTSRSGCSSTARRAGRRPGERWTASPGGALERTLHRDYYLSDQIFALEQERIFFREWFCVGREEELPDPGDYLVRDVAGESVLVVRTRDGGARRPLQRLPPPRLAARARRRPRHLQRRHPLPLPLLDLHARRRAPHRALPRGERRARQGRPVAPPGRRGRPGAGSSSSTSRPPTAEARRPDARGPARRRARAAPALSAGRAARGAADRVRGRGQLEGDAGELQRVLPLRAGASRALPAGAGVQAAGRRRPRLGAGHPAPRGRLDLHRPAAPPTARRSRA